MEERAKLGAVLKGLSSTSRAAGALAVALAVICCGGDKSPTAPEDRPTAMVGEYSGVFDYVVVRNAAPDPEASLHCELLLVISYASVDALGGRMEAMGSSSGCGEPGTRFAYFNGSIERGTSGSNLTLTMSPNLGAHVGCVAFQVNPLPGNYHAGPSSSEELQLSRDFVCADAAGDWLKVHVRYAGSRRLGG